MRLPVLPVALLLGLVAGCARHHAEYTAVGPVGSVGSAAPVGKDSPQYTAMYSKPLTSLGAKHAQLTPAAQTTVLADLGAALPISGVPGGAGWTVVPRGLPVWRSRAD